jgi:hypothetical protein
VAPYESLKVIVKVYVPTLLESISLNEMVLNSSSKVIHFSSPSTDIVTTSPSLSIDSGISKINELEEVDDTSNGSIIGAPSEKYGSELVRMLIYIGK